MCNENDNEIIMKPMKIIIMIMKYGEENDGKIIIIMKW